MSWIGQVGHVMAKDLRHLAWLVAISVLVTATATLRATNVIGDPVDERTRLTWMFVFRGISDMPLVLLVGVVLVILLLQSDSSARSDAFWVTRPLAPSAVLAAKVAVVVALLLVLPLGGQLAALIAHDVPAGRLLPLLAESATATVGVLGVAAAFAALTPDLRTLLAAFLLTFLGWGITVRTLTAPLSQRGVLWTGDLALYLPGAALALAGLSVAAYQYRTRDVRRTVRVLALPALLVTALVAIPRGQPAAEGPRGEVPTELRTAVVTVAVRDLRTGTGRGEGAWEAVLTLHLPEADASHQYVLSGGSVTFVLRDGSSVVRSFRGYGQRDIPLNTPQLDAPGYAWIGPHRSVMGGAQGTVWIPVPDPLARALRAGDVRARVDGRVVVRAPREVARIPVRAGAAWSKDGITYRIDRVEDALTGPLVTTSVELVASDKDLWQPSPLDRYDAVVLNDTRKEAAALAVRGGGGGMGRDLVLPGPTAREYRGAFATLPDRDGAGWITLDMAWMRSAVMALVDWVPIGGYALDADVRTVTLRP